MPYDDPQRLIAAAAGEVDLVYEAHFGRRVRAIDDRKSWMKPERARSAVGSGELNM